MPWSPCFIVNTFYTFAHQLYGRVERYQVYVSPWAIRYDDVGWADECCAKYLGPSALQLAHLFTLLVVNFVTLFALAILFVRSLWSLGSNTTTIEGWEIERHDALLRRARVLGGYLDGPDGVKVRIKRQEFPYDIGIWKNVKQGMGGSSNVGQLPQTVSCLSLLCMS